MKLLTALARAFVAGETQDEAIKVVKRLNKKNIMATLDFLGENVRNKEDAENAVKAYISLLDKINDSGVISHVSLKLTQMGLDIDSDYCIKNVSEILKRASEYGNFVRIDMEGSPYTQRTLDIFYRLCKDFRNVGVVIQAYLHRSERDIENINAVKGRVRLCKGAYKEPQEIAFKKMSDVRENFVKLSKSLLLDGNYPAIATHDTRLIEFVKKVVEECDIPKTQFEFQMLYGIRPKTHEKLAQEGYNFRVYVPFGTHWLPYFYRRIRERKENLLFVLKNLFKK